MKKLPLSRVSLANSRARANFDAWLGRTVKGFDTILRSQVFTKDSYDEVVDLVWRECHLGELTDDLLFFESREREKVGPMSIMFPYKDREPGVHQYFSSKKFDADDEAFSGAVRDAKSLVNGSKLNPLSLEEAYQRLPKNKFKGLPMFTSSEDVIGVYIERAREVIAGGNVTILPSVLGWRGQAGGRSKQDVKQRTIFMVDKTEALLGGMYAYPAIDHLRNDQRFIAWNSPGLRDSVVERGISGAPDVISTDFSEFDSSLGPEWLYAFFDVVTTWFGEMDRPLEWLRTFAGESGLVTPEGILVGVQGSVISGSVFTGLRGSITNFMSARYVARRLGISHKFGTYLGDDSINRFEPFPGLEEIAGAYSELGLVANPAKQYIGREVAHFLQNVYAPEFQFRPVRPVMRAMQSLLNYERPAPKGWSHAMAAVRTLMQLENCRNHPSFSTFLELVRKEDPYLSLPQKELFARAGGKEQIEQTLGLDSWGFGRPNLDIAREWVVFEG